MAYLQSTYSGVNDALNQMASFAVANGWAQNLLDDDASKYSGDVFTGRRLHIQKTINGKSCYFNLRSSSGQTCFSGYSGDVDCRVTGINCNGSTGFDSLEPWDQQPGFTNAVKDNPSKSAGGCVDAMVSGAIHMFSTDTSLSFAFQTNSIYEDFRFISVGLTTAGLPSFECSGGYATVPDGTYNYPARSGLLSRLSSTGDARGTMYTGGVVLGTGVWLVRHAMVAAGSSFAPSGTLNTLVDGTSLQLDGSYLEPFVAFSPEPFKGNAPLPDTLLTYKQATGVYVPLGVLEGFHVINMTNYADGHQITMGSDNFKVFRQGDKIEGFAFKM